MSKYNRSAHQPPVWVSQNFLTSSSIISRIVGLSSLSRQDHVIEIGAGKGHITEKLLDRCGRVTALEIDRGLFRALEAKFERRPNLDLLCRDFLRWTLPETPYKVFANIPFNRTTDILRKLTDGARTPEEAWLVVEKGAAKRFAGKPHDSLSSLLLKPFFSAEIAYHFRREDFHPMPSVDAVLLHLAKRSTPDIADAQRPLYHRFLSDCLRKPGGVRAMLTKKQITTALRNEKLSCDIIRGEILYVQWLCLFRCCLKNGIIRI